MSRSLGIPAVGCLLAFAALYGALNRAEGDEDQSPTALAYTSADVVPQEDSTPRVESAESVLRALCDAYLTRVREWESSPHRMLSRAAPRIDVPTAIEFVISPTSAGEESSFALATITVTRRVETQTIPCVVDSSNRRVRIFHEGKWLTGEEWLQTASLLP